MVNSLSKGNEICGSEAVATLLDDGVHPTRGRLTLGFANVEAYRQLDVHDPAPSKFLDVNFNRIWKDEILDGPHSGSVAREVELGTPDAARGARRRHSPRPSVRLLLSRPPARGMTRRSSRTSRSPQHVASRTESGFRCITSAVRPGRAANHSGLLFEYGRFSDRESAAAGFLAECGPHFARASVANSLNVTARGSSRRSTWSTAIPPTGTAPSRTRGEIAVYTDMVALGRGVRLVPVGRVSSTATRPFSKGELIATDGARRIEAPWDDCVLITVAEDVRKG